MKYTVTWSRHSESKLASLWVSAPDRQAVRSAADSIDHRLRTDPLNAGESRPANRRIVHEPPLRVIFSVNSADGSVLVLDVWRFDKHKR
jgi:hypothetical protein